MGLNPKAQANIAWLSEEAERRPADEVKLLAQAEAIRNDPTYLIRVGLTNHAQACTQAWQKRIEEIKRTLNGIVQ